MHGPLNVKVKEGAELYLYSPLWAFMASSGVNSIIKSRTLRWAGYVVCIAYIQSFGGET
jgi:hypothetical protein